MLPVPNRSCVRGPLLGCIASFALAAAAATVHAQQPQQTLRKLAADFVSPVALTSLDADQLLVIDQAGLIYVLDAQGKRRAEPFLDVRPRLCELKQGFDERGLLGVALHPRFKENRRIYAYYSAPLRKGASDKWDHTSRLSEFTVSPDFARVPLDSERVLLEFDQPYFNHNGGSLAFGPDGFLYFASGDGGNANDQGHDRSPGGNGQDLTTLLGKILRIDVDRTEANRPYAIPADNPFIAVTHARPEIYALGLRNPWGMRFDRGGDRELFSADVGQGRYEEINIIRRGGNYGWNQREGRHAFDPKNPLQIRVESVAQPSDRSAFTEPVLEYRNLNGFPQDPSAAGLSVTGGFVYRGQALPHLQGRYVFADWSRQWAMPDGRLFVATRPTGAGAAWTMEPLPVASHPDLKLGMYVVAFGEDAAGELYVMTTTKAGLVDRTGVVWKLVPVELAATAK